LSGLRLYAVPAIRGGSELLQVAQTVSCDGSRARSQVIHEVNEGMRVKRHTVVLNQVGTDRKLTGRVTLLEEKVGTIVHSIVNEFQQTERSMRLLPT